MKLINFFGNGFMDIMNGDNYYLIIGVIFSILWFVGTIIFAIVKWTDSDVSSGHILLSLTAGSALAGILGPIILLFVVILGLPTLILDVLRGVY